MWSNRTRNNWYTSNSRDGGKHSIVQDWQKTRDTMQESVEERTGLATGRSLNRVSGTALGLHARIVQEWRSMRVVATKVVQALDLAN